MISKKQYSKSDKKFYVSLTHDVDKIHKSYQCFTKGFKHLFLGNFKLSFYHLFSAFIINPYWNFDKIIEIEKKFSVKSTFFFLDESIRFNLFRPLTWKLSPGKYRIRNPKIKKIIQWLDKNGWEIGLHGSYYSFKSLELLKKEKRRLESIIGHNIIGIRQHYLNLNINTWELQSKAGFKYDASFGFTRKIGFKDNHFQPFFPLSKNKKFMVIPLVIMDSCLMNKENIRKEYLKIIDIAERNHAVLALNWHQRVFNEKEFPDYLKVYTEIIKECKKRKAQFNLLRIVFNEYAQC